MFHRDMLHKIAAPFYALPFVWRASRVPFVVMSVVLVLDGLIAPLMTVLLGVTVQHFSQPYDFWQTQTMTLLICWGAVFLCNALFQVITFSVSGRMNEDMGTYMQQLLLEKGSNLKTLEFFDDPRNFDTISLLVNESKSRPSNYVVLYASILKEAVTLISYIVLIASLSLFAPLVLLAASVPLTYAYISMRKQNWFGIKSRADQARYLEYISHLFLSRDRFVDLRLNDTYTYFNHAFHEVKASLLGFLRQQRRTCIMRNLPFLLLGIAGYIMAICLLLYSAHRTGIMIAALAAALQAFLALRATISSLVDNLSFLGERAFFFKDLRSFLLHTESVDAPCTLTLQSPNKISSEDSSKMSGLNTVQSSLDQMPSMTGSTDSGRTTHSSLSTSVLISNSSKGTKRSLTHSVSSNEDHYTPAIIRFDGVSYACPSNALRPVLNAVSFTIYQGERVAIVGKNGSGKSTLLKLMTGMAFPTHGTVYAHEKVLTYARLDEWRRKVSMVPQTPQGFAISIADNIGFGVYEETDVQKACSEVSLRADTCALEDVLGVEFGGRELSGGELQRLAIARAFMRNTPVLLLDEPTSAIDPIYEAQLYDRLLQLTEGKTSVIVTHRIPQALAATKVIVLDEGCVVEQGSPAQLIASDGLFAQMVAEQTRILAHDCADGASCTR